MARLIASFATFAGFQMAGLAHLCGDGERLHSPRNCPTCRLAARHAVPAISPYRDFLSLAVALCAMDAISLKQLRLVGFYAVAFSRARSRPTCRSKQPNKLSWSINLKTAKALGLTVPMSLLGRADEVIE